MKETNSKEAHHKFVAPVEETSEDFIENVMKLTKEPSEKGYLSDIRNNNVSIVDYEET